MSDYIHIDSGYFSLMEIKGIDIPEIVLLSKIISFANVTLTHKNANAACRASNDYFADLMHKDKRTVQRYLQHLKDNELIYVYEYKQDKFNTTERYIFPNWSKINELCEVELPEHSIPDFVINNATKSRGDKSDIANASTMSNLTGGDDKSDTLIIDSNRHIILDIPSESDESLSEGFSVFMDEVGMDLSIKEQLFVYLKYVADVDDNLFGVASHYYYVVTSPEYNDTDIKAELNRYGFNWREYGTRDEVLSEYDLFKRYVVDIRNQEKEDGLIRK